MSQRIIPHRLHSVWFHMFISNPLLQIGKILSIAMPSKSNSVILGDSSNFALKLPLTPQPPILQGLISSIFMSWRRRGSWTYLWRRWKFILIVVFFVVAWISWSWDLGADSLNTRSFTSGEFGSCFGIRNINSVFDKIVIGLERSSHTSHMKIRYNNY